MQKELERFVTVRLDVTDSKGPDAHGQTDLFHSPSLPTIGFISPHGDVLQDKLVGAGGIDASNLTPKGFIDLLKSIQ